MANENIAINMDNLDEEEREQLLALIEKANKPQKKLWQPQEKERFYYIDCEGKVATWGFSLINHQPRLKMGNCFQTRAEAKFALERLKVLYELKMLANGFNPLKERKDGYILGYDLSFKKVEIVSTYGAGYIFNDIPFETESKAQKAIETIGEERLKKYYFCIEL